MICFNKECLCQQPFAFTCSCNWAEYLTASQGILKFFDSLYYLFAATSFSWPMLAQTTQPALEIIWIKHECIALVAIHVDECSTSLHSMRINATKGESICGRKTQDGIWTTSSKRTLHTNHARTIKRFALILCDGKSLCAAEFYYRGILNFSEMLYV